MFLTVVFIFYLQGGEKLSHILLHICWTLPPKQAKDLRATRQDTSQVSTVTLLRQFYHTPAIFPISINRQNMGLAGILTVSTAE